MADLATLRIVVDSSGAIRAVDQFGKTAEAATKRAESLVAASKRVGLAVGGVLAAGMVLATRETIDAQREQAQLAAALRSTGGAAGQTLDSLNEHAAALRRSTAATGGQISEAQALLLTFTKIGGEAFPQATQAVLDMAQALGTDARGAAMQLGKALNDPLLGVTALGRAGVQFSAAQKAMIAGFVETNQLAKAQGIILAELNTQVGGSAAAYRNTLGGALAAVKESFLELFEVASPGMVALVENLNIMADSISMLPTRFAQATTGIQSFFNKALIALLEFNQRGRPSKMLDGARARQGGLDATGAGLDHLLAQQQRDVLAGINARVGAGSGRGLSGGAATIPDPAIVTATVEAVKAFHNALKDLGKGFDQDAEVRAKADRLLKQGVKEVAAGVQELSESARVFLEQTQIALGGFFSDFLKEGFTSARRFFDQFAQLGRDAIGNLFAKSVMEGIGAEIKTRLKDAFSGVAGGIFGGVLVTAITGLMNASNAMERAVRATNRAIADFGRRPQDEALTDEQRRFKALEDERDGLVKRALGDRGFGSLAGSSFADTRTRTETSLANIRSTLNNPGLTLSSAMRQTLQATERSLVAALAQIDAIGTAFDANTQAIQRNILAMENQRRAEQSASLARFGDSLKLSAQSPLSPTAQLAEARRQYDVILALAKAGDQSAISSLPETARTLLDASRAVNASGVRYAQDFARVQGDVAGLVTSLGNQIVDVRDSVLDRMDPYFTDAISIADASFTVQQEGFSAVVAELVNVKAELVVMKESLKLALDEVATAVS